MKKQNEYLDTLAPMGIFKHAFKLYEQQTRELVKTGGVSDETKESILWFAKWCAENGYQPLIVIPCWIRE